ncbi:TetR/AcrR family transcriptional regulator [Microbacterium ulmi]|uniref:Helix-turn-helix transcriptional regulator n=1 Tax=Microbacterium ulmi TaxID=179095 RepID=A0A7Y2M2S7_9MICO|nr:TetR/AcrR family transcriptional regulator [Microbacterium ulmi]NII70430.1 AcrR family transcriptional regulator [Microbacterium ulmi]NNH04969.1 helix-turn-helix transcriptional regulator [Microbacterium ulmi]
MVDAAHESSATSATVAVLLDAALAEVLAHGIRRTTASDIARRAGVARQTLYRYWPDVQTLFAALVTRELLAVLPRVEATGLDGLVDLLVTTADGIRRMPLVDRLRDTDPELFARYVLERVGTSQRAIHADLARRIDAGQRAGFVRPGHPDRIAAMLLLTIQSAVQSAPIVAEWLPAQAWAHELALIVRGYLAVDA